MQNQKKVIIGLIMIIVGCLFLALAFYTKPYLVLYFISLSLLIIPIGFWLTLYTLKRKILYSVMGLLDAISAPLFIYLSMFLLNCNYIQMSPFINSLIFGGIGALLGIIGILGEVKSLKILKSKNNLNVLLILQIVLWDFSMMFASVSPATAYYM